MSNPFSQDGADTVAIFKACRLNPSIPEHNAVIETKLKHYKGSKDYEECLQRCKIFWARQAAIREERMETEPQSVIKENDKPLAQAMAETSSPETRVVAKEPISVDGTVKPEAPESVTVDSVVKVEKKKRKYTKRKTSTSSHK